MKKLAENAFEYKELLIGLMVCIFVQSSAKGILIFLVIWYAQKFYFEYKEKERIENQDIIESFKRIEPKRKFKLADGRAVEQFKENGDSVPEYL
jgi:hypothetical protein